MEDLIDDAIREMRERAAIDALTGLEQASRMADAIGNLLQAIRRDAAEAVTYGVLPAPDVAKAATALAQVILGKSA